ncbi:hypothetical protein D3C81_795310 [compost metagenome]
MTKPSGMMVLTVPPTVLVCGPLFLYVSTRFCAVFTSSGWLGKFTSASISVPSTML